MIKQRADFVVVANANGERVERTVEGEYLDGNLVRVPIPPDMLGQPVTVRPNSAMFPEAFTLPAPDADR